jgi:hypothetical protein
VRRQALEPATEVTSGGNNRESDFIERLGLAAWIELEPGSSTPIQGLITGKPEAKHQVNELALVLSDFVAGDSKGRKK